MLMRREAHNGGGGRARQGYATAKLSMKDLIRARVQRFVGRRSFTHGDGHSGSVSVAGIKLKGMRRDQSAASFAKRLMTGKSLRHAKGQCAAQFDHINIFVRRSYCPDKKRTLTLGTFNAGTGKVPSSEIVVSVATP